MPRKTQSQKRIDMAGSNKTTEPIDLGAIAESLMVHVEGAIATLGKEAQEGNVTAAKTILDFISSVARDEGAGGSKGMDILKKIAEIRGS